MALALMLLVTGSHGAPRQAAAQVLGAGTFNLDQSSYVVVEGEVVFVRILRTNGAVLTGDVVVTVQIFGGLAEFDYPQSTITQLATFPANSNPTSATVGFQTLNQMRLTNGTIQVKILSVSNGGQVGTLNTAPITILGFGTPRLSSITPKSGGNPSPAGPGTVVNIQGINFLSNTSQIIEVGFQDVLSPELPVPDGNPTVAVGYTTAPSFFIQSPTALNVTVPAGLNTARYHIRVKLDIAPPVGSADPHKYSRSGAVAADIFYATNGPTVTVMFPSQGPTSGGTVVTLNGTGFSPASCPAAVYFGTVPAVASPATGFQLCTPISTTQMKVAAPPNSPGVVDVVVSFVLGPPGTVPPPGPQVSPPTAETKFTYTGGPQVTAINPSAGPAVGGTVVTVTGTGFAGPWGGVNNANCVGAGAIGVRVGGLAPTACTVLSDTQITLTTPAHTGIQQITVNHPTAGASAFTTAANFSYVTGPVVTGLSPGIGPPAGGALVVISGSGFAANATVTFGVSPSPSVVVVSATTINAVAPPGTGTVPVIVTVSGVASPDTPADDFTYSGPAVSKVEPNAGPTAGATTVTITGLNFVMGATVLFGELPATTVTFVSPTTITAVTPKVLAGKTVDVRVSTASGQSAVNAPADQFTYTDGPIVATMEPKTGPTVGGTIVILTGTNFPLPPPATCTAVVKFGTTVADQVNCNSATQITVLSPPVGAAGVVDVTITMPAGTSPANDQTKFTYTPQPPTIIQISPNTSPLFGGVTVQVSGIGFLGVVCPDGVKFGAVKATSCTVNNDTSITAVAPPNVAGDTFLSVTSPAGTNPIVPNFTYVPGPGGGSSGGGGGTGANPARPPAGLQVLALPPASGQPVFYQLSARWTLLIWRGPDGATLPGAVQPILARVSVIYAWDADRSRWLGWFPANGTTPGANDFGALFRGGLYWIAISGDGPATFGTTDS